MNVENDSRISSLASRRFTIATSLIPHPSSTSPFAFAFLYFITNGYHGTFGLCLIDGYSSLLLLTKISVR